MTLPEGNNKITCFNYLKLCENAPPCRRRVSTQSLVSPTSTRVDIGVYQHKMYIGVYQHKMYYTSKTKDILYGI